MQRAAQCLQDGSQAYQLKIKPLRFKPPDRIPSSPPVHGDVILMRSKINLIPSKHTNADWTCAIGQMESLDTSSESRLTSMWVHYIYEARPQLE